MAIEPYLLDKIRDATPLVPLIECDVPLRRSGNSFSGLCPFHGEQTPSFHVYPKHFHCFGCGAHGDCIDYVREKHGLHFPDAVRLLASEAGIEMPGSRGPLSAEELAKHQAEATARAEDNARQREAEQKQRMTDYEEIRKLANWIWDKKSRPADPAHPYLVRKQIGPEHYRQDERGNLLVPLRDERGALWNIEKVLPERPAQGRNDKYPLQKSAEGRRVTGRVAGVFAPYGDLNAPGPIVVATGSATAHSIHSATGYATLRAGSDNNLLAVATKMRELYPDRLLIIAGDNDHKHEGQVDARGIPKVNGGKMRATEAAEAVAGLALLPEFPPGAKGSDFNDVMIERGAPAIKEAFASAIETFNKPQERSTMSETLATPDSKHPWEEVWVRVHEQLKGDPSLAKQYPELTEQLNSLVAMAERGVSLDDAGYRTRLAYVVADLDRITGRTTPLTPAIRSEVDVLAISSPGLNHEGLLESLRLTSELGRDDLPLIQDVRRAAWQYVRHGHDPERGAAPEHIAALDSRVTSRLAGPEAPPHVEIPSHLAEPTPTVTAQTPVPAPAAAPEQQPAAPNPSQPAEAVQPAPVPVQDQPAPAAVQGQPPPQPGRQPTAAVAHGASWASGALDATATKPAVGRPPWQGVANALSGRMAAYRLAHADGVSADLHRRAESAATVVVDALRKIETGPAADVLRRVTTEAASDPNGVAGVISQMRPGGRHEAMRNDLNTLFVENKAFAGAYDRAKMAVGNYLESREALARNYEARGWNINDLDQKLGPTDQAIAERLEKTPGRTSGNSMVDEMAERAMKMAKELIERVKQAFGRAPAATPAAAPAAAARAPELSPSI